MNTILSHLVKRINNEKIEPTNNGSSKYCYVTNKYVVLEDKEELTTYKKITRMVSFSKIQQINDAFLSLGISTPKIIDAFSFNNKFYELQERVLGQPLYMIGDEAIFRRYVLRNTSLMLKTPHDQLYSEVGKYLEKSIINMQLKLLKTPQSCFDKLMEDIIKMNYCYRERDNVALLPCDPNPQNIIFNSINGFTFIDLDYDRMVLRAPGLVNFTDSDILSKVLRIFSYSTYKKDEYDFQHISTIYENNIGITSKLLKASQNNGLVCEENHIGIQENLQLLVGKENFDRVKGMMFSKSKN